MYGCTGCRTLVSGTRIAGDTPCPGLARTWLDAATAKSRQESGQIVDIYSAGAGRGLGAGSLIM